MSRGHGHLERKLLGILDASEKLRDTFELAAEAFELKPDHNGRIVLSLAQLSSVRRALVTLGREGQIVAVGRGWHNRRARWANKRAYEAYGARVARAFDPQAPEVPQSARQS